jgi:hypothetical protein
MKLTLQNNPGSTQMPRVLQGIAGVARGGERSSRLMRAHILSVKPVLTLSTQ